MHETRYEKNAWKTSASRRFFAPERRNAVACVCKIKGLADKKCVWGDYSVEYGYAALRWNSDHVSPLPHSTGSMLGTGFPE